MLNIAVIGAGAAGLCVARHIKSRLNMKAVIYEQTNSIGGAWVYSEETGKDQNGLKVHSAMYKNLKTNLPKELMEFPDFPFDEKLPTFLTHEQVLCYLEQYCENFKLQECIQFGTVVKHVKPISLFDGKNVWEVTVKDLKSRTESTAEFDAVFVCNGHYGEPHVPIIPGREYFEGLMMHSHSYRHPEAFAGKRVVLFGCNSSGQDISLDVAKYAKNVVICHRTPVLQSPLPDNVSQAVTLSRFEPDGKTVCFADGSKTEADAFIYCTGYEYSFPFLDETCGVTVDGKRIRHLYKHMVNLSLPSMFFIGICSRICPFPQFHCQAAYCVAILEGHVKLPTKAEMLEEIENDFQNRLELGWSPRAFHTMGPLQWRYNNGLANLARCPSLHPRMEKLSAQINSSRMEMLCDYKKNVVRLRGDGSYGLLLPSNDAQ